MASNIPLSILPHIPPDHPLFAEKKALLKMDVIMMNGIPFGTCHVIASKAEVEAFLRKWYDFEQKKKVEEID